MIFCEFFVCVDIYEIHILANKLSVVETVDRMIRSYELHFNSELVT